MKRWNKAVFALAFLLFAPLMAADQVAGPLTGSGTTKAGPQLEASAQVLTDKGIVEGKAHSTLSVRLGQASADSKIRIFLGIPYAAPPVGELRWKAPQPVPSWTGVKKTTQFGHRPMQGHRGVG